MPKIKEYTSRIDAVGPIQTRALTGKDLGSDAWAGAANAAEGAMALGGVLQRNNEMAGISLAAKTAAKMDRESTEWSINAAKDADATDPTKIDFYDKAKSYIEQAHTDYTDQTQGFSTPKAQAYFDKITGIQKENFLKQAAITQSHLQGEAGKNSIIETMQEYQTALTSDPTYFENRKALMSEYISQLVEAKYIDKDTAFKLQKMSDGALTEGHLKGLLSKELPVTDPNAVNDPTRVVNRLKSGEFDNDIDLKLKEELIRYGEHKNDADFTSIEHARTIRDQAKQDATDKIGQDWFGKYIKGKLKASDIDKIPASEMDTANKIHWYSMIKAQANEPQRSQPGRFNEVLNKIWKNEIQNHTQLDNEYKKGGFVYEDLNKLRGELDGTKTSEGKLQNAMRKKTLDEWEKVVTGKQPFLPADPKGLERWDDTQKQLIDWQKKITDKGEDPMTAFDRGSKNYFGTPDRIRPITPTEWSQNLSRSLKPPQPGEAPKPPPGGLSEKAALYNKILPQFNGTKENAFSDEGVPPTIINPAAWKRAEEVYTGKTKPFFPTIIQDTFNEMARKGAEETIKEQNKIRTDAGLPPLTGTNPTEPPSGKRPSAVERLRQKLAK